MGAIPSHRHVIKETELNDVVEVLKHYRHQFGLNTPASDYLAKLQLLQAKINVGAATPAYVTTGHSRKVGEITLESLGASQDAQDNNLGSMFVSSIPTHNEPTQMGNSNGELNSEQEDELERLEREMLESLQGIGNDNVILNERRKEPR